MEHIKNFKKEFEKELIDLLKNDAWRHNRKLSIIYYIDDNKKTIKKIDFSDHSEKVYEIHNNITNTTINCYDKDNKPLSIETIKNYYDLSIDNRFDMLYRKETYITVDHNQSVVSNIPKSYNNIYYHNSDTDLLELKNSNVHIYLDFKNNVRLAKLLSGVSCNINGGKDVIISISEILNNEDIIAGVEPRYSYEIDTKTLGVKGKEIRDDYIKEFNIKLSKEDCDSIINYKAERNFITNIIEFINSKYKNDIIMSSEYKARGSIIKSIDNVSYMSYINTNDIEICLEDDIKTRFIISATDIIFIIDDLCELFDKYYSTTSIIEKINKFISDDDYIYTKKVKTSTKKLGCAEIENTVISNISNNKIESAEYETTTLIEHDEFSIFSKIVKDENNNIISATSNYMYKYSENIDDLLLLRNLSYHKHGDICSIDVEKIDRFEHLYYLNEQNSNMEYGLFDSKNRLAFYRTISNNIKTITISSMFRRDEDKLLNITIDKIDKGFNLSISIDDMVYKYRNIEDNNLEKLFVESIDDSIDENFIKNAVDYIFEFKENNDPYKKSKSNLKFEEYEDDIIKVFVDRDEDYIYYIEIELKNENTVYEFTEDNESKKLLYDKLCSIITFEEV